MINEIRTILLNESGTTSYPPDYPGEEYVPLDFKAITLPHQLREIYTVLFGHKTDRAFKNAMLATYLKIIHSLPKLAFHVYEPDPRVTYYPGESNLFDYFLTGPKVTNTSDNKLLTTDKYYQIDPGTRLYYSYSLAVKSSSTVEVSYVDNAGKPTVDTLSFTTENNMSSPVKLPISELEVQFEPTVNAAWTVEFVVKPKFFIEQIIYRLYDKVSVEYLSSLFDKGKYPFNDFKTYWEGSADMPTKLGSVVLALAYNMRELQNG